ncbi:hypothetical protein Lqui_2021 [Legionella quinlivanii]|uniref:Murein L,D-transpeptidase catalytic domain family protein n=1 Tax=Legionella quinlivanii TaxID=45073 RepID=A0A0W0XUV3_9GAMM|nr:murein L,D-transpeptidase catalytic domain family protein [Legionella quinlivanii]KTD48210.1 hypothetical protein Lqui_2021 [Legionella quinlivanii]MCW8450478.1 murein L,D-transpeptidase catalytic domain family protein [Legionella quinlivanii]SEF98867.1 L,D-transpeptidase catalytic domain [Legionella quinlivanii DSM 21216]STY11342.1 Uncharacterised protein [Legionella quinlivanii]
MSTVISLLSALFFSSHSAPTHPISSQVAAAAKPASNLSVKVQHLSKKAPQLNKKVLKLALAAYQKASAKGAVKKPLLTVIDYSLPSNKQRMWIFDLNKERLLYNTYVAHGKNSGMDVPKHFSNKVSSKESSLGTYVTRDTYYGSKGLSLNLQGLERGINDNAYNRRVVIHGAWYVEPDFIKKTGRAGRSWGCPSIAQTLAKPVINTIKGGSVVFAYYPDKFYLSHTGYAMA